MVHGVIVTEYKGVSSEAVAKRVCKTTGETKKSKTQPFYPCSLDENSVLRQADS